MVLFSVPAHPSAPPLWTPLRGRRIKPHVAFGVWQVD